MLIKLNGTNETKRVQCPWVSEEEVQPVTDFLRSQGEPVYDENILKPRDDEAAEDDDDGETARLAHTAMTFCRVRRMQRLRTPRGTLAAGVFFLSLLTAAVARADEPHPTADVPPPAVADATASARLEVTGPWGQWCTAPSCRAADAHAARGAIIVVPPSVDSANMQGAIEAQVKARVLDELAKLTQVTGPWNTAPLRDLTRVVLALVTHDDVSLKTTQGISASLARASLTYAVEHALPATPACTDRARIDAVYEGLAMSPGLAGLAFPERTGAASAACAPLAHAAEQLVDATLAGSVVPKEVVVALARASASVDAARSACAAGSKNPKLPVSDETKATLHAVVEPDGLQTPRDLGAALPRLRASLDDVKSHAAVVGDACVSAFGDLASADAATFAKLEAEGLGAANTRSVAEALDAAQRACADGASCADREVVTKLLLRLRIGLRKEDLALAIHILAERLAVPGAESGLVHAILDACAASVVVSPEGVVAIDETEVVRRISQEYLPPLVGFLVPSPFVLDASAGVPSLAGKDVRLVGDLTIGYRTSRWGIVGRGAVSYYDLSTGDGISTDNLHALGAAEGFLLSGTDASELRLEGRFSGGIDYYDTTTIQHPTANAKFRFGDYDSLIVRGILEVGVQWQPSEKLQIIARGGGGVQYETFDTTSLDANGLSFQSPTNTSARGTGTLMARWRVVPQYLAFRVRGSVNVLSITRETLAFTSSAAGVQSLTNTSTVDTQVEGQGRLFVDLDVLRFAGEATHAATAQTR